MNVISPSPPTHPLFDDDTLAWLGHLEVLEAANWVASTRRSRKPDLELCEIDPDITPEVVALWQLHYAVQQAEANLVEAQLAYRVGLECYQKEESYR